MFVPFIWTVFAAAGKFSPQLCSRLIVLLVVCGREMEKSKLFCGIAVSEPGYFNPEPDSGRIPHQYYSTFFQSLLKTVDN